MKQIKRMSQATDEELKEYFETLVEPLVKYIRRHWCWKGLKPKRFKKIIERMNAMACKHETRNMEKILNEETPDSWKVVFLQAETSVSRHKFLFVRVEGK